MILRDYFEDGRIRQEMYNKDICVENGRGQWEYFATLSLYEGLKKCWYWAVIYGVYGHGNIWNYRRLKLVDTMQDPESEGMLLEVMPKDSRGILESHWRRLQIGMSEYMSMRLRAQAVMEQRKAEGKSAIVDKAYLKNVVGTRHEIKKQYREL